MKRIRTEIFIKSPKEKIWDILMNFSNYSSWNPFIIGIAGKVAIGEKLEVCILPPNSSKMKFTPKIISIIPNKELIWKGTFLFSALFNGEHRFILEDMGDETKFVHEESFDGILSYIFPKSLYENTEKGFKLMNSALKKLAEKDTLGI
jgi:hypothetical protein